MKAYNAWFVLIGFLVPLIGVDRTSPVHAAPAANTAGWYAPREADFRPVYEADAANQRKQSWPEYWDWVKKFYSGNRVFFVFQPGWTSRSKEALSQVGSRTRQAALRRSLNRLGQRIAGEWAKDNAVRKIDTNDVRGWGDRMRRAKDEDGGDGEVLKSTIQQIEREVDTKLGRS